MPDSTDLRPFSASLPMALLHAREVAMRYFRPMLAEHNLTEQQWRVLRALSAASEPIDAGELAARTYLLAPSLSRIIAHLDERGLITRTKDEIDQRRTLVSLSAEGEEQVDAIAPKSEAQYARIEDAYGPDELQELMEALHRFAERADTGDAQS